jgi:patatin-like phospholipase/acyl hydrolase
VLPDDLLRHIVDQRLAVNEGGGVKGAILQALLDHLSDGGLREGPVVDLLLLLSG